MDSRTAQTKDWIYVSSAGRQLGDGCLRATLRAALREERLAEKALGERQKIEEKSPFQLHAAGLTHSGT